MNKKLIIILSGIFLLVVTILFIVLQPRLTDNSTITDEHYYVQKGYEKVAKLIKPAIEIYLKQDVKESTEKRKERLARIFKADSPVYDYPAEYLSNEVDRVVGKLTSVYSETIEEQDVIYAVVGVSLHYKDGKMLKTTNTYWLDIAKDSDGNYTHLKDLGVLQ